MPRPPSSSPRKTVRIDPALQRAIARARLDAQDRGEEFPETLSAFLELAARDWLQRHAPEALTPRRGRPHKGS